MKTVALIVVCVVIAACAAGFVIMERRKTDVRKIVLIAVMTAMSVAGRFVFAALPGFKPVTAVVVLCGMYLGADAGFICGALSALISNCYFGQGPWTPFQMLVWGIIGVVAGLMGGTLQKSRIALMIYAVAAGIAFSFLMDIYIVIWAVGGWSWAYYGAAIVSAVPYTVIYAVSNVIFLAVLSRAVGKKIARVVNKYHIVENEAQNT